MNAQPASSPVLQLQNAPGFWPPLGECRFSRVRALILNTLRQGWQQQQPSANSKRGEYRATLKAGLWDEPPQLARARNRFLIDRDSEREPKFERCEMTTPHAAKPNDGDDGWETTSR